MSVMVIWLMGILMIDIIVITLSVVSGAILGYLAAIVIIVLIVIIMYLIRKLRRRGSYNLEYPADFYSAADQDQRDRFDQEGIDKHYK